MTDHIENSTYIISLFKEYFALVNNHSYYNNYSIYSDFLRSKNSKENKQEQIKRKRSNNIKLIIKINYHS